MFTSCSNGGRQRSAAAFWLVAAGVVLLGPARLGAQTPHPEPDGQAVYLKWCAGCHGDKGEGNGEAAAYLLPRPRNFTLGVYKFRSTPSGEVPTDADLKRILDAGIPGTPMVGWQAKLTNQERDALVGYVKGLSPFFGGAVPSPIAAGRPPAVTPEGLAEGRQVYQTLRCSECHGAAGRGDGTSVPSFADDGGFPIPASDLTEGWKFKGGGSVEQIYLRLRTGLDGTPMPSFGEQVESKVITDEQLWRLAQYVRSLSSEQPPEVSPMLHVAASTGPLPTSPADSSWNSVEQHYLPLSGQIVVKPRWFTPTVDGVWVQAIHDGRRLALKLTWHDPSRSPDPAFDPWLARMVKALPTVDGPIPTAQGPDRVTVVFPRVLQPDSLRPYFLGGDTKSPAYIWRWTSTPNAVEEGTARGLTRVARRTTTEVTGVGTFDRGEWQLQLTRPLASSDSAATTFLAGQALPFALFVADGSNGEVGPRGAVSGWFTLHLEETTAAATNR